MTAVSGHGPWPGGERDVLEAQQTVLGDLADLPTGVEPIPFLVQLTGRGPGAGATARTSLLLAEHAVELGPHGWKLADHDGVDARRARSLLAEDLATLAITGHGYTGPLAVEVTGPWTLAAELWSARGDRVLADVGGRAALTEALAVGLADHVAQVRDQVPGADVVVQLAEPLLGQVHAGVLPTFSGFSRLRGVPGPDIVEGLRPVVEAVHDAGARVVVHLGGTWVGIPPVVLAGADAIGLDLADVAPEGWNERAWELVARATERKVGLWAGLPPARVSQCAGPELGGLVRLVAEPWRRIGLPAAGLESVTVLAAPRRTPGSVDDHRAGLANLGRVAEALAERAAD
ncbi:MULTISPECIES: hypothetical protein [unclassified Isoptericola]|uniref:hypothetical protein n=1 Tax=unclassified Isoptericola TaxID=2623355 RepID=UPI0027122F89|nr:MULTISPECIES: hypothetical protein [unclassified Isoptericola]MDO8146827.1 hypothetical protein [Isoptericola sp. b515]MDO8150859.1 hypothetical protein [Isoptericola sp. b408]